MKKKQALQPNLPKLKLDKERIMALTAARAAMIAGGVAPIKRENDDASNFALMCSRSVRTSQ